MLYIRESMSCTNKLAKRFFSIKNIKTEDIIIKLNNHYIIKIQ